MQLSPYATPYSVVLHPELDVLAYCFIILVCLAVAYVLFCFGCVVWRVAKRRKEAR